MRWHSFSHIQLAQVPDKQTGIAIIKQRCIINNR
jgi:hypothetical protein